MYARIHFIIITTQIYAKITMQKLNADMDELEKKLSDLNGHI
jgi:polyhydroxyalkanoate synthesis regulator phasin